MDWEKALAVLFAELRVVATHGPNERLPKEEQSRCSLYSFLRPHFDAICVERGYKSIDERHRRECDLYIAKAGHPPIWLELKHCRCAQGWANKPTEELRNWEVDLDKLRDVPLASVRFFLLVCFADFDLSQSKLPRHGTVVRSVREFHSRHQIHQQFSTFCWRKDDGICHIGATVWRWDVGKRIGRPALT